MGGLETLVVSLVVTDKVLEMMGGAVVDGVGGTTDIGLVITADVMVAVVVVGGAATAVVEVGGVADVVVGGAVTSAMGGAPVASEIGGAAVSVMGEAPDVLIVEDISLAVDLVADVIGNESAIKVGGDVDTTVVVDEITLELGGAVVGVSKVGRGAAAVTEVGGALVEIRVMDKVGLIEGAENVTEDSIVVTAAAIVVVAGETKVGIDKTDLVLSDKTGVAAVESLSAGDLVKVSSCPSSDCSVSSSLVTSLSFCPLNGLVRLSVILASLALNE